MPSGLVMDKYESTRRTKLRVFPVEEAAHAGSRRSRRREEAGPEGASVPRRLRLLLCPCPSGVGWNLCAKLLCACDQSAAECMASAFYNQSLQLAGSRECQGDRPNCEGSGNAASAPASSSEEDSEESLPFTEVLRRTRSFLGKPLGLVGTRPPYGPR